MRISVCICTYRRPQQLGWLLDDLGAQTLKPDEVVVVDNAPERSGEAVVSEAATRLPFPLRYASQPVKNISRTRNKAVELAQGEWLALLDDDERAPPDWLSLMHATVIACAADGAIGPVVAIVPPNAPAWIRRGHFYQAVPRTPTGERMPLNRIGIGNALLRAAPVKALTGPFDEAYGLTGGEDGDMLTRLTQAGARIVSCEEAAVTEPVAQDRLNLRWLLMRAIRGQQDYTIHWFKGRYGGLRFYSKPLFYPRALALMGVAALLALIALPFGRHRAARWLIAACGNFGKLSTLWGWHHQEYAAPKSG